MSNSRSIPVVLVNLNHPASTITAISLREAGRMLGREETIRKQLSRDLEESTFTNVVDSSQTTWYIETASTFFG